MNVLGIETSCDETAAAVVVDGVDLRSNVIASQAELHSRHGGIVPELASRQHIQAILPVLHAAVEDAAIPWSGIDAVAVTNGPGLAGSLIVGLNAAKGLAASLGVPMIGVNHLEGHVRAAWLAEGNPEGNPEGNTNGNADLGTEPPFPLMCLIVSGGHTELVLMRGETDYELVGATRDDAAGEAFDKSARILGLPYPGGPEISRVARAVPDTKPLPRAWIPGTHDFSFSGLKTALLRRAEEAGIVDEPASEASEEKIAGLSHELQESIVDVLVRKANAAADEYGCNAIILAGGVAANRRLRQVLTAEATVSVFIPPPILCTDNGAMIAAAAYPRLIRGEASDYELDVDPGLRIGAAA
ncbi:MAG: tRNA (adenosine(37)-N6)-threonylcarbamoyltransferase complex transferase subunit TsaD [Chloroflexi bacterium]|nr:tRNA (adenosine(37)-N6)-threonylcarbamoyltransferase complex transferase subunit TsaD [Chloroflexota bacterium]